MIAIGCKRFTEDEEPLSVRLVERVANHAGVDVQALPPLYDVIDPDALDSLVHADLWNGQVMFTYFGYAVTIRSDGEIEFESDG